MILYRRCFLSILRGTNLKTVLSPSTCSFTLPCKYLNSSVRVQFLLQRDFFCIGYFKWLCTTSCNCSRLIRNSAYLATVKKGPKRECSAVFIKSSDNGKLKKTGQKLRETTKIVRERIGGFKENVLTVPNGLSVLRMGLTPLLCYLVVDGSYPSALGIFVFAGITDLLDGFIARTFPGQQSMIGSFLDPMADKLLVATLFLSLTVVGLIPIPLTVLIIARDFCLVAAGFYIRYHSLPHPRTISRYFDVTFATAKLSPTFFSKVNTALQLSLAAVTLASPVFHYVDHPYIHLLWYVVASTTVISGISYIFTKDTYKFIGSRPSRKA